MSVLFFAHSSALAGAERNLIELVDELVSDHGVVCTVVAPNAGPLVDRIKLAGAATVTNSMLGWWAFPRGSSTPAAMRQQIADGSRALCCVMPMLEKIDPDIVYTQTMTIPWGAATAALLNKPHLWSICEFGELDHGLSFVDGFDALIEEIEAGASCILTPSDAVRTALFPGRPNLTRKICRIHQRVHVPSGPMDAAAGAFKRPGAVKLAVFGTLHESKGQADAVRAVAKLVADGRDVELLLAGYADVGYRAKIDALTTELDVGAHVRISEFLEDPHPTMLATDIVLVCSRHEAFGRVPVEGMLLGRPVIYPRSGGIPEYMEDGMTGLSYAPGNVDELASRIGELIDDPEFAARIGKQARHHAVTKFTRSAYGGAVFRLMQDLRRNKHQPVDMPGQIISAMAQAIRYDSHEQEALRGHILQSKIQLVDAENEREKLRRHFVQLENQLVARTRELEQRHAEALNDLANLKRSRLLKFGRWVRRIGRLPVPY